MAENIEKCKEWYRQNRGLYNSCGQTVCDLIGKLLDRNQLPYHSINYRVKEEESFLTKCKNNKYDDPTAQITDVCGLRIISYTNRDVENIQRLIENEFDIDKDNSVDKRTKLNEDQVGYLSVHYIATLKDNRTSLDEYQAYSGIKFEIQIRTLLQHAWAEIEHDRNYKFSGALPRDIKRRFYLVAGVLEFLDREFQQISNDIDAYAEQVRESTEKGDLGSLIDSTTLMEYLSAYSKKYPDFVPTLNGRDKEIVAELHGFGVETLADLDRLIKKTKDYVSKHKGNYVGFLRHVMMIVDPDTYFEKSWNENWSAMETETYELIKSYNPDIDKYLNDKYIKYVE